MAKQITTTVSDDIDGSPDAQSVAFAFQGVTYSIDLASKNLDKLTKALAPFIDHAARQRGGSVKPEAAKSNRPYDIAQLREWAGKNKVSVPKRGRIPQAVVEQYKAAGGR